MAKRFIDKTALITGAVTLVDGGATSQNLALSG